MNESKTKALGSEISERNRGNATGNDIVFDPVSGELMLVKPGEQRNPDATTINQIAEDGFA